MEQMAPEIIYKEKIAGLECQTKALKKKDTLLGFLKLVVGIAAVLCVFRVIPGNIFFIMGLLFFLVFLFIGFAVVHEGVIRRIKYLATLRSINEKELGFLQMQFPDGGDSGDVFKSSSHPYSADIDIFGSKGIYHYLNRAVTAMGKQSLAQQLQAPSSVEEIKQRQEAVQELAQMVDLRQTIAAQGLFIDDSSAKLDALNRFLKEPFFLYGTKGICFLLYGLPGVTVMAALLMFFRVPFIVFLFFVLMQVIVNKIYFSRVTRLYKLTTNSHKVLKAYSLIMSEMERGNFHSFRLKQLQQQLTAHWQGVEQFKASQCIKRLSHLLEYFDSRNSMFHIIPAFTLLWDLHCVYRIERWRAQTASYVSPWFTAIGEFEMLASFAAVQFNNPGWVMPRITDAPFRFCAKALGHPLIPSGERICNDVTLTINQDATGKGCMMVITGPNMAGKSTFLRAVGVNIVLALAGGPVCATDFEITPVKLYTSMLVSDSLDKHLSLFYAELERLKMIIDGITAGEPVFFMIDEMLKGTNALDRQKGAIALLKQLEKHHANGIVATHDLELTKLSQLNYHFDGYIEDDKLLFDYRLKSGTCLSFNALVLMKKMGIDIP